MKTNCQAPPRWSNRRGWLIAILLLALALIVIGTVPLQELAARREVEN